jgi:hypothetical protein
MRTRAGAGGLRAGFVLVLGGLRHAAK